VKYIYSIPLADVTITIAIKIEGIIDKFFISNFESSDQFKTKN